LRDEVIERVEDKLFAIVVGAAGRRGGEGGGGKGGEDGGAGGEDFVCRVGGTRLAKGSEKRRRRGRQGNLRVTVRGMVSNIFEAIALE
jgi:hypothetical protein